MKNATEDSKKIFGIFAYDSSIDAEAFCRNLREWNIGYAILDPGFFFDDRMLASLRRHELKLWLNLPIFHNPPYLEDHKDHYSKANFGNRAHSDRCFCLPAEGTVSERTRFPPYTNDRAEWVMTN